MRDRYKSPEIESSRKKKKRPSGDQTLMTNGLNSLHCGGWGGGSGRDRGGGGNNSGGGSIGGRGTTGARGEPCYICDSHEHVWRKCPELLCQRCKKKGYGVIYCKGTGNTVMAVGLTGGGAVAKEKVVETDDESAVSSEAECRMSLPSKMGQASVCCRKGIMRGTNPARG